MEAQTEGDRPEPVPPENSTEEQLTAFADRFKMLQEEALGFGITSVVGLTCYDPLCREAWHRLGHVGDWFAARGLIEQITREMDAE